MCHPHAICTLEYFPNHYWSALLQPLPSLPVKLMDAKSRWRKKWLLPGWSTNQISDKNHFGMIERSWNQGEKCVCVFGFWMPHTLALMLFLITFVAAIHAHLAPIWTHVALHALHSRLARAQTRHLLTIIPDWARSVAVACCRGKVEKKWERLMRGGKGQSISDDGRKRDRNSSVYSLYKLCLKQP